MQIAIARTDWLVLDAALRVGVQRTLRVPGDGRTYPLPPALGRLPLRLAAEYPGVPQVRRDGTHVLVPMRPQEAAWFEFRARPDAPRALRIGVGSINALSGAAWSDTLHGAPQDYLVCPYQPWIDGFKVGPARVRQFVAVPLQAGLSVEHQLTGRDSGAIRLACYAPRVGVEVPPAPPRRRRHRDLGLGAGGTITQRIYPDPYSADFWQTSPTAIAWLHLLDAEDFCRLTGEEAPPSPIDAETYLRFGLPWFEVHDADRGDVAATEAMSAIQGVDDVSPRPGRQQRQPAKAPGPVRPIPPRARRRR
jgi:hypothetical protein